MNRTMPLMKCGCVAQGRILLGPKKGYPVCVIHIGILREAEQSAATQPDLSGRMAKCVYCHRVVPSGLDLPFFTYRPEQPTDRHYDGCRGWD